MLAELRISKLGVIADTTVEFAPGFTAITGETGAGKTMIVTGLGLFVGAKAESRLIRHGAEKARVEARWSVSEDIAGRVDELGGEIESGELLTARVLTPSRSSSFVGGAQVPVKTATELMSDLLTIHGQSEQLRLGTPDRQREVLDRFAGEKLLELLGKYRECYRQRQHNMTELASLSGAEADRIRELEITQAALAEIDEVRPQPDEDQKLAAEAKILLAAEDLVNSATQASICLSGDDDETVGAYSLVFRANSSLQEAATTDDRATALANRCQELQFLLADLSAEVSQYLADLEPDPVRLEWIAGRQAALQKLLRKYGETIGDVLAWEEKSSRRVLALLGADERIAELTETIASQTEQLQHWAVEISKFRQHAATKLASAVEVELSALAMPHAKLVFSVTPADLGPYGADSIQLLFSANAGSPPAPLAKVASGGELSRVRLALEVVLADGQGNTFIFDEVDAGVGGNVALEIGRRLQRLAQTAQVIVVTHLAQVAAFADRQIVVAKSSDGDVTSSDVEIVTGDARAVELARMMAGMDTAAALAHAQELLELAGVTNE